MAVESYLFKIFMAGPTIVLDVKNIPSLVILNLFISEGPCFRHICSTRYNLLYVSGPRLSE